MSDRLPIAIIGCGKMGRLHARVCSQLPRVRLVGVYDTSHLAAKAAAAEFAVPAFDSIDDLLAQARAVCIAVPTVHHLAVARQCLLRKVPCLIEKPIAPDSDSARQIVDLARQAGVVVQVGHIERFNPAVRAMCGLNMAPRFIEVIRVSPLTFRGIDVGVVLDMMIHDIDIVLRLAGSEITHVSAVTVSVLGEGAGEDVCNARLTFANGCVANLAASRLSLKTERKLRVFSPDAYVSLDYHKKHATVIRRGRNLSAIRDAVSQIRAGQITDLSQLNFTELVDMEELTISDAEPARAQMESFVASVLDSAPVEVSADQGLAAVRTAERIVQAARPQSL